MVYLPFVICQSWIDVAAKLPKGGGRQGTYSCFLQSLLPLISCSYIQVPGPIIVERKPVPSLPPALFTFEKREVELPQGPELG